MRLIATALVSIALLIAPMLSLACGMPEEVSMKAPTTNWLVWGKVLGQHVQIQRIPRRLLREYVRADQLRHQFDHLVGSHILL